MELKEQNFKMENYKKRELNTIRFAALHTAAMDYWELNKEVLLEQMERNINVGGVFANRAAERKAIKAQKDAMLQLKKSFERFEKPNNAMIKQLESITRTPKFEEKTDAIFDFVEDLIK